MIWGQVSTMGPPSGQNLTVAMRFHYNADSNITRSPSGPPLKKSSTICVKMSADNRGIYNADCEMCTTSVFPSQVSHQLIFPVAVSTGHSIYKAYEIGDHVLLKDDWATFVYRIKPPLHVENVIIMINNAGDVFQLCICKKRKHNL